MQTKPTFLYAILMALTLALPLTGCPSANDDDSAVGDDDDATGDDDDATGDDDDSAGDDDDSAGDDDDSSGDDDDSAGDDDDSAGDDDDSAGDDDDSSGPCGMDDLTTSLEIRAGGVTGATFASTDVLTYAGIVNNPCPFEVTVTSISTCLAVSWSAEPGTGVALGGGMACGDALTDYTVPELDSIESTIEVGTLPVGTYTGTVSFDVPSLPAASTTFTVQ